ncbi:MAG: winged helix-turn-helix transcriptional regulator [Hungatella sp.]|nr:winged helix-turn-helix transcriptional regulator [Hungatella sp.]
MEERRGWDVGIQKTFKALSDQNRREILDLLKGGAMTAGEIGEHFPVSGATVSHHLSILKEAGLILDDRQGKYIYYELNTSVVDELIGWVSGLKGES